MPFFPSRVDPQPCRRWPPISLHLLLLCLVSPSTLLLPLTSWAGWTAASLGTNALTVRQGDVRQTHTQPVCVCVWVGYQVMAWFRHLPPSAEISTESLYTVTLLTPYKGRRYLVAVTSGELQWIRQHLHTAAKEVNEILPQSAEGIQDTPLLMDTRNGSMGPSPQSCKESPPLIYFSFI